jgi:5'-deoxynucleotidase YfbR-like HD superfamily hydrolase
LTEALTDGRLEAAEYAVADERLRRAVTYADMDAVVSALDAKASLVERDQAIARIEAAVDSGLLDPAERHGRVEAARNATTDAQLAALVADLTTNPSSPAAPARVSNADREAVAARLHDAVEAGFLDLTEFDERVREVYAARLSSELERVVVDLPEPAPAPEPLPAEPPVEKPRRVRRPVDISTVITYGIFGFAFAGVLWGFMYGRGLGALTHLPLVLWLIGLVALMRRARRPAAADLEEPHDEQLDEEMQRRSERLTHQAHQALRSVERLGQLALQFEQVMERLEQVPPDVAAQIAKRYRELRVMERHALLREQIRKLKKQGRQNGKQFVKLAGRLDQVPREVVEKLKRQFEYLTGQYEDLTEQTDQLANDIEQVANDIESS